MWAKPGTVLPACGAPRISLKRWRVEREAGSHAWKEFRSGRERNISVGCGDGMMVVRDAGACAAVVVGAYALVRAFDVLTERQVVDQKLSRKIIHILSGILFMSSWPFFSSSNDARLFAASVPLLNSVRLAIYGFGLVKDEGFVKSMTREGKPEELLKGPLYYVFVLMFCVLVFWRESPVGIISLSMMSGGDGFADIMGRKYGKIKLPYNENKSWVGSLCMFVSGFALSMGMLYYFSSLGYLELDWGPVATKVAIVSLAATVVESLPISDVFDDNFTVPLCCISVASVLFGF